MVADHSSINSRSERLDAIVFADRAHSCARSRCDATMSSSFVDAPSTMKKDPAPVSVEASSGQSRFPVSAATDASWSSSSAAAEAAEARCSATSRLRSSASAMSSARWASASMPPAMAAISRESEASTWSGELAEPWCGPTSRACFASRRSLRAALVFARARSLRCVDVDAPRDAASRAAAVGARSASATSRPRCVALRCVLVAVVSPPPRAVTATDATRGGMGRARTPLNPNPAARELFMHGAPVDCAMSSAAASHETISETRLEGADTAAQLW